MRDPHDWKQYPPDDRSIMEQLSGKLRAGQVPTTDEIKAATRIVIV